MLHKIELFRDLQNYHIQKRKRFCVFNYHKNLGGNPRDYLIEIPFNTFQVGPFIFMKSI